MTHNLSFRYHADMTTKGLGLGLGLGSAKVEVLRVLMYSPAIDTVNRRQYQGVHLYISIIMTLILSN